MTPNITIGKAVKRNTELTGIVATLELRTAQELQWQKRYTKFLRLSKKYI